MVLTTIDEFSERKLFSIGMQEWLYEHDNDVQRWLHNNAESISDVENMLETVIFGSDEMLSYVFFQYLQAQEVSESKRFQRVCMHIKGRDGGVFPVVGPKRRGKTCLVYSICEFLHKYFGFKIWWLGPPANLPPFFSGQTLDDSKIPKNVIVVVDEAAIQAGSRSTHDEEQQEFVKKLAVSGHHGKYYFVITQNAAIFDLTFLRQADGIFFTGHSLLSLKNERLIVNEYLNYFMPKKVGEALYYDDSLITDFSWELPIWWKEKYSKPYAPFVSDAECYKFVIKIMQDFPSIDNKKLASFVHKRDRRIEEHELEFIRQLVSSFGTYKLLEMGDLKLQDLVRKGYDDTPINDILAGKKGEVKRFEWEQDAIIGEYWKNKIKEKPELETILKINQNKFLIDYIKQKKRESHICLYILGPTDSGKSWLSVSVAEVVALIHKLKFILKGHIFETPDKMIDANKTAKKPESLILDDQRKRYGPDSNKEQWDLANMVQALRKKGVNFIFNSQDMKASFTPKFYLEAWGFNRKEGISKALLLGVDMKPLGYITVRKPSEQNIKTYIEFEEGFKTKIQQRDISMVNPAGERIAKLKAELKTDKVYRSKTTNKSKISYFIEKHGLSMEGASMIVAAMNDES